MNDPKIRALLIQFMTDMLALLKSDTAIEMTAQQYIDQQDNPATGAPVAAEVFADSVVTDAAQVFAQPDAAAVFAVSVAPVYEMTAVAVGFSREQYHAQGWTDAQLIEAHMMVDVTPKPAPAPAPYTAAVVTAPNVPVAPPPTSTATAPVAPPAASGVPAPSAPVVTLNPASLDSTGMPWDGRIHASTQTKTQKGEWKMKRGVDDAVIAAVTAELRAAVAAPAARAFTPLNAPAAPAAPAAPPQAPKPPAAPSAPAAPAAPRVAPTTFVELCRYTQSRALNAARILEVCQKFGLPGLGTVATREDLIPQIFAEFELK